MEEAVAIVTAGSEPAVFLLHIREEDLPKLSQLLRRLGVEHDVETVWCG
jgi:hypothetical protein